MPDPAALHHKAQEALERILDRDDELRRQTGPEKFVPEEHLQFLEIEEI